MALYSEPTSMIGSSGRMCADRSPARAKPSAGAIKIDPPRRAEGLRPGACLRCGCATTGTAHATPNDCIDALREALADVLAGEVRRTGRPSSHARIKGATEVATPME